MDKRLKAIVSYLEGFHTLYDVGSDHALLPITAIKQNKIQKAYAIDNKQGPLDQAKKNIEKAGLKDRIYPILSDGLSALSSDVDVVVIAGLGGASIKAIMQSYQDNHVKRFILAPNTDEYHIRDIVNHKHLKITEECYLEQKQRFYPIFILEAGNQTLSQDETKLSKPLIKAKDQTYKHALSKRLEDIDNTLAKIPKENQPDHLKEEKARLRRALDAWHKA